MKLSHYSSLLCLLSAILLCGAHSASVKDKQAETDLVLVETEQEERPEVYERVGAFSKDDYDPYAPRFIPSREWQAIKKGQAIPPGLHVRMNLETGEREAKLLDGDDGSRFEIAAPDELDETIEGRTGGRVGRVNAVKLAAAKNASVFLSLNLSGHNGDVEL